MAFPASSPPPDPLLREAPAVDFEVVCTASDEPQAATSATSATVHCALPAARPTKALARCCLERRFPMISHRCHARIVF